MSMYNIYIYGAGQKYNQFMAIYHKYSDQLNVIGIVTTERSIYSYIDGIPMIQADDMEFDCVEYIIIAADAWHEISQDLLNRGCCKDKIIRSHIFFLPNFDWEEYLSLKKSQLSILSNCCLGGMLYRKLGLEMLSPTINMFCLGKDWIEFVSNYKYYLKCEMKQYIDEVSMNGLRGTEQFFPKGILDEKLIWYFNHDKTAEGAINNWNRRCKRVNLDNVVVVEIILNDDAAYAFDALPTKRKLGIYHKDLHLTNVMYIPEWEDKNIRFSCHGSWIGFANNYMAGEGGFIGAIDWIKFLKGDNDFKRFKYR